MIDLSQPIFVQDDITVDLSMLFEMADESDTAIVKTIVGLFLSNMPPTLDEMQQSLDKKDWDELSKKAHYAKSSLSAVQIEQMQTAALQIENDARHRVGLENMPRLVAQLKKQYKSAAIVLKTVLAGL